VVIDWIVTPQNAFAVAERLARKPDATREELEAAACVLCQSPDWQQRVLGKELRMGLYAGRGAELISPAAKRAAAAVWFSDGVVAGVRAFDTYCWKRWA
jgi:hypothetical protein